jgi:hypothetical protein
MILNVIQKHNKPLKVAVLRPVLWLTPHTQMLYRASNWDGLLRSKMYTENAREMWMFSCSTEAGTQRAGDYELFYGKWNESP